MTRYNTQRRYGSVTKSFHWLTALLILALIPLGIMANKAAHAPEPDFERAAFLFSLHKTLGVTVFAVAILRILWALRQAKPGPLHPDRRAETLLAEIVHWTLYGSLVLVPLTGWISHAATEGFAPIWWPFGQGLPFVPVDQTIKSFFAGLHIVFERVLVISIFLHVAGALKHQFIDRDSTLRRMWFGNRDAVDVPPHRHSAIPAVLAGGAFALAIGVGSAIGMFEKSTAPVQAAALDTVGSDWTVADGNIALSITQFGNTVTGEFTDWTAAIVFNPEPAEVQGNVDVTINIGSLVMGSVRDQAMGPDFFDADQFATATFVGELLAVPDDGIVMDGTLTIKDQSVPIAVPMSMLVDGDTATSSGSITLDRRSFGIGDSMADESSLAFAVDVSINLTATRTAN